MPDFPRFEVFVCVPVTSPLRTVEDLDTCIRTFLASDVDTVITVTEASHNPYYNMVTVDENGEARQAIEGADQVYERGSYPTVYEMTTVAYVARPDFVLNSVNPFMGKVKAVQIPPDRALDIDTELDLKVAELVLNERKGPKPEHLGGAT
jgi:N-acylneuraminate cytidylyltransferase